MKKKILHFLRYSIIGVVVLCIVVFVWMTNFMVARNEKTMEKVCQTYTTQMGQQLANHFHSVVVSRITLTKGIAEQVTSGAYQNYGEELIEALKFGGEMRNFQYVALYAEDGAANTVYGSELTVVDESAFLQDVSENGQAVASGKDASGNGYLLFGIRSAYPMQDGKSSAALVTGLPAEYINDTMSPPDEESLVYFHIIRKDGSYVLQNPNNHADNYFDWMRNEPKYDGKDSQQIMEDLKKAIAENKEYSVLAMVDKERRNIYFEPLENTDFYLATVLLYGTMDTAVSDLGNDQLFVALISCGIILVMLLVVSLFYTYLSKLQLVELEKEKQRADRANYAKSDFLSNMSHDIRTPMNGIVGMTAIATANIDNKNVVQEALYKITLSSKHLLGLINDVLDMSKIETGKLSIGCEQISLREFMENVVSIVQPQIREKQQSFDIFIQNILCEEIYSDSVRLNQILINLLSNAMKYTPTGGSIFVTLSQEESSKGANYVRTHIRVKDNGIGIAEEFQKKIFDSFTREDNQRIRQIEGTGLGMAITKCIVDAMGGTIEVESEQGKGSEFHVTLDFERVKEQEKDMVLPSCEMLLVDNDEQLCEYTVKSLQEIGIHAEWTLSGREAVEMAKKRVEKGKSYQIVLLDWQMPDMDGIETARELRRQLGEDIPILLMSAYDWSDIEQEARGAGIQGFIGKPLFKSTLYHGLRQYLDKKTEVSDMPEKPKFDFTGRHLLVAEDYDINWEICNKLLSVYGFQLDWAENGQICVDRFRESEPGYYDVILMDLRMPVMNGYEATKAIRAMNREDSDLPIIAMTADAFSEDIQRCLECGINTHVAKPIDMNKLLKVLQTYINE